MNSHKLVPLLDRAYTRGYLDREQALRDFGAEHHTAIAANLGSNADLADLLRQAHIGASDHWAVFVLEGALTADVRGNVMQQWLTNPVRHPRACSTIATRCALRVLPLLDHQRLADHSNTQSGVLLTTFWGTCAAWLCSAWPDLLGDIGHANLRSKLRQRTDIEPSMAAAHVADFVIDYVFSGVDDEHMPAVARDALTSAQAAVRRLAPTLAEPFRVAFARDAVAATRAAHSDSADLDDLPLSPLWPDGTPPLIAEHWRRLATRMEHLDQNWFVWTHWYNGRLHGSRALPDVERDRVAIAEDLLLDDPPTVNRAVREGIDQQVMRRFPDQQPLAIDATTQRLTLACIDVADHRAFDRVCDQLLDTLKPFTDARFANLYADLNDPVQLLSGTLTTRREFPLTVHRRVNQVAREIERLASSDETRYADFNVRTLLEDLSDAAVTIPLAVPAVAEEVAKRTASRLAGLPTDDRDAIKEAAGLLAENSDEAVCEIVEDAIDALDATESATPLSDPDSQRVYTLGWMMAKLPALKAAATAGLKFVTNLQAVFAAVDKVYHLILRLFL